MEFTEILRGRYGLSERAAGVLMRHASQSVHARKEIIVEEGQRDQEIRFVTEGSARSYVMREDKCVILSFAFEGDPTSSTLGAWPGGISGHTIETMEPTTLVRLPREALFADDTVYACVDGRLRARPAEVVYVDEDYAYLRGLEPGTLVVAESLVNPSDGMEIGLLEGRRASDKTE